MSHILSDCMRCRRSVDELCHALVDITWDAQPIVFSGHVSPISPGFPRRHTVLLCRSCTQLLYDAVSACLHPQERG